MSYVLQHTRLGFCWLDLIALAVLILAIVVFVVRRRQLIREEKKLEEEVSSIFAQIMLFSSSNLAFSSTRTSFRLSVHPP